MKRTSLEPLHEARGARWMEFHGWEIPALYSDVAHEYQALQEGVGLIDLSHRQRLRITGRDRRSWLHGQVTQDVNNLPDWKAAYSTLITAQGKMVCDLRIFALPDALWVDCPAGTAQPLAEYLDRFLIMERAEIEDLTESWSALSLQGPLSPCVLDAALGEGASNLAAWELCERACEEQPVYVVRTQKCGEDGFDLLVPSAAAANLWAALSQGRREFAVHSVGWEALNIRRVEAGIPWWGEELDSTIVPLEARLERGIHMHKGCYVGQEIIARIDARGHVNNLLAGFFIHGERLPARGSEIHAEGKKIGRVSTALRSLKLDRPIGLGYLRREFQAPGTPVQALTPEGQVELEVAAVPFIPHDYPQPGDPSPCPPAEP